MVYERYGAPEVLEMREVEIPVPGDRDVLIRLEAASVNRSDCGGEGAFAVQMAKAAGAEVTGVDNAMKQEFMRSLGADHVLDYTRTDYTRTKLRYDLILDLVCERSMFAIRRAIAPSGRYAVAGGSVPALLSAATVGRLLSTGGRRIGVLMMRPNKEDLLRVADMVAAGALRTTIERIYPLERVPEALRHLGEGRALGKLVIDIG